MSIPITHSDAVDTPFHPSLEQTAARAALWHGAQVDDLGRPHVEHLIAVSSVVARMFPDASKAERHAAWLHDVIDDTRITSQDLVSLGYAPEVVQIVAALSRHGAPGRGYAEWITAFAETAPLGALRVKLAELACLDRADPLRAPQAIKAVGAGVADQSVTVRLRAALKRRAHDPGDRDPQPADMIPLTVPLEPLDFWVLGEAAALAGRTAADFMAEEALDLAHRIIATGSLRHVELARDRKAEAAPIMQAFRASPRRHGPLSDFEPPDRPTNDDPDEKN